jgi:hypothetical protein
VRSLDSAPASTIEPDSNVLAKHLYTTVLPRNAQDSDLAFLAERRRDAVDSLVAANQHATILVTELPGRRFALMARAEDPPDSADDVFSMVRDARGRVTSISEAPVSASGDWEIQLTHYFDTTGATTVVARRASFFNGCTSEKGDSTIGIDERVTSFFAPSHRLVKRTFVRTAFNNSPAPTTSCNDSFQTEYSIYPTWDSLSTATGLGAFLRKPHT